MAQLYGVKPREAAPFTQPDTWRSFTWTARLESEGKALVADFFRGLSREAETFTRANEKFHLSLTLQHGNVTEASHKVISDYDTILNRICKTS